MKSGAQKKRGSPRHKQSKRLNIQSSARKTSDSQKQKQSKRLNLKSGARKKGGSQKQKQSSLRKSGTRKKSDLLSSMRPLSKCRKRHTMVLRAIRLSS